MKRYFEIILLASLYLSLEAFTANVAFIRRIGSNSLVDNECSFSQLASCRTNAKKEKIKRNRENMRKFKTGGRKGLTRRKLLKKAQSSKARQDEAEFIAKCYVTTIASSGDDKK